MLLSMPPVVEQFSALFGVSYGGLSVLFSAYFWTHCPAQVPAGLLVDRLGTALSLRISFGVSLACMLVPLLMPDSLALAVAARLVFGVCVAGFFLASVRVVKLITPAAQVTRVQGAQGAAFSLGTMLPYIVLPWFGSVGWVASYIISALFCLVLLCVSFRLPLRAMRRMRHVPAPRETWEAVKVLAVSKEVWFLGCSHGLAFGSLFSVIGSWLPSLLVDMQPGSTTETWAATASVLLLVGTAGRLLGGEAARKMHRGLILNRITLVVGLSYIVFAFSPSPMHVIVAGAVMALACGAGYASALTLGMDTAEPGYMATRVGFMNMIGNLLSMLLILFLGLVRDVTGSFGSSLCISGVLALVLWFVSRKLAAGMETR